VPDRDIRMALEARDSQQSSVSHGLEKAWRVARERWLEYGSGSTVCGE